MACEPKLRPKTLQAVRLALASAAVNKSGTGWDVAT